MVFADCGDVVGVFSYTSQEEFCFPSSVAILRRGCWVLSPVAHQFGDYL
jgi:hypothetical protein